MKLGFVTAILPEISFEEVLATAQSIGYKTVEVMCWPVGRAERRYAGVTHIDVADMTQTRAEDIRSLCEKYDVGISALGYYPNPLAPDPEERKMCADHIHRLLKAAKLLGLSNVNSFIGRDPNKSIEAQWPIFLEVWNPIIAAAEELEINLGIENCPMIFSNDEWPGGKNLAISPAVWRRMFTDIPSSRFGLNFDPSHLVWLMIEPEPAIREFAKRIFHVHAKDARLDRHKLQDVGVMGLDWHTPKLPGLGDVNWGRFFGALTDGGYDGAVCVEVEDRAFERTPRDRIRSLEISFRYLSPFVV